MSREIDMAPNWSTTLRIYGLALRNPDLDYDGEKNAFLGLQEAANHLDNTYPERCRAYRDEIAQLQTQVRLLREAYADDNELEFVRELQAMTDAQLNAAHDEYSDYATDRAGSVHGEMALMEVSWIDAELGRRNDDEDAAVYLAETDQHFESGY